MTERSTENMQEIVDEAPITFQYCTDGFSTDDVLDYHQGRHLIEPGKSQTYSIEGGNADLRHYLARLAKRSRCFSCSLQAFKNTIKLFVYCWNRRQLFHCAYPTYSRPLIGFLHPFEF